MTTFDVIGCDGSVWNLLDVTHSAVTLSNGLGGLHLPTVSQFFTGTPGKRGSQWRGSQMKSRQFQMSVLVGDLNPPYRVGDAWRSLDGRWWEAWSTDELTTLVFNGQRTLQVRLDEDNSFVYPKDPALHGKAVYPMSLIAESPAWEGAPITENFPWAPAAVTNYYGGVVGLGPPFYITQADLFNTAMVSNPGDLPTWPIYTITGPSTSVTVGVQGHTITPPFGLRDGDVVIIDTDQETITDGQGNNLYPQMGYATLDFSPIPVGDQVPISIGMSGAQLGAGISVTVTPQYRRAWGVSPDIPIDVPLPPPSGGLGDGALGDDSLGD